MTTEVARGWIKSEVRANVIELIRTRYGSEQFEQEAMIALCDSARLFNPVEHPDVPFGAYARLHVRRRLWRFTRLVARSRHVHNTMPTDREGSQFLEPSDYRREDADPALKAWCSPDYTEQRRCLDMRSRLILYLRCVAGLALEDVGEVLSISKERVRQIELKATQKLARFRNSRRIKRQLATGRAE